MNNLVFEKVFKEHAPFMRSICRRECRDPRDAEDAFQMASFRVWQGLKTFNGKSAIRSWIYRVTINEAWQILRWSRRTTFPADNPDLSVSISSLEELAYASEKKSADARRARLALATKEPDGFDLTFRREIREVITKIVAGSKYKKELALREIEGLSFSQGAKVLGISLAAMKSRVHSGRGNIINAIRKGKFLQAA